MFFNKKILRPESIKELNKKDIIFVNNENVITTFIKDRNIYRLIEFVNNFMEGTAAVKKNKYGSEEFYIHKMIFESYTLGEKSKEYSELFLQPLKKFKLTCTSDFLAEADYMILHIYVTYKENAKRGSVINIKLDFN